MRRSVSILATRAVLAAVGSLVVGALIDRYAGGEPVGLMIWTLAGLSAGAAVLGWLWPVLADGTASTVENALRLRILDVVIRNPAVRYRTGEVANRASDGVSAVGSLAGKFVPQLVGGVVIPLLICGLVATIDVVSALVLLITVPAIPMLLRGMEKRFTSVTTRYRETADLLSARFFDGAQGMKTLRDLDASGEYGQDLAEESEQLRGETMALLKVNQLALLVVDSLFTLGTVVAATAVAMWRLGNGVVSIGDAVSIVLLGVALIEPVSQVGRFFYMGAMGRAAARDIRSFLAATADGPGFVARHGDEGWVELKDVTFSYDDGPPAVESVSLRVEPGETVGLVGPSGAGKSTIAGLISGLLRPDEGTVRTGGRVAVVSQHPFLMHGTVRDNLLLAAPGAGDDELWAALRAVDLDRLAGERGGLDLEVGERGLRLSGGEAQRLTIARLRLADAPVVLLDEPTSNVDIETETRVRHALGLLTVGKTVVVIAHRRSTLSGVDRVVTVRSGKISEMAAP